MNPSQFGKYPIIPWREADTLQKRQDREASKLQHAVVYAIRRRMDEARLRASSVAEEAEIDYNRFVGTLRGSHIMRLDTLAAAQFVLTQALTETSRPVDLLTEAAQFNTEQIDA